jgi:hypothetical protein
MYTVEPGETVTLRAVPAGRLLYTVEAAGFRRGTYSSYLDPDERVTINIG